MSMLLSRDISAAGSTASNTACTYNSYSTAGSGNPVLRYPGHSGEEVALNIAKRTGKTPK
jgi:hypothetical protein